MLYILMAVLVFGMDLRIKNRIEETREIGRDEEILGGRIILHRYHNKGAMLNFMEKRKKAVTCIAAGMTAGALSAFCLLLGKKGSHVLKTGLALILGGASSNLYDRLKRGYVVDYFSFCTRWKKLRSIVFNLSDICIFAGSFLFICCSAVRRSS